MLPSKPGHWKFGALSGKSPIIASACALACALAPVSVLAVQELHPSFTRKNVLHADLNAITGIGGIGLLPNGDGVICTWGGSQKTIGELWIIPALASGTPGKPTRITTGMREPLGLKVVGNDFYVMEKPRILKYTGSGTTWTKTTVWSLPTAWYDDNQWHHFSLGLEVRDNYLWFATGTAYDYTANDPIQRGALIRVPLAGGTHTQLARGLRNPNGLGIGPENQFFTTENEGHWKPENALYHIPTENVPANGRFFGFRTNGNNSCGITPPRVDGTSCSNDPEYPPAIWIPYGGVSRSPSRLLMLKSGAYAGQMISGDVHLGGTLRYFLEKVKGEYQGAVFSFMTGGAAGSNFGINQMLYTPDGNILVAGIGGGSVCGTAGSDNWSWKSTCRGLDYLTPASAVPFDILAIRSIEGGFEIEFTKPAGTAANTTSNYNVKTTVITPVQTYGGDSSATDNNVTVNISSVSLSSDGLKATLKTASLNTRRMYAITLNTNIKSTSNENLYTNVGYYTLNNVGPATPPVGIRADVSGASWASARVSSQAGRIAFELPFTQPYRFALFNVRGEKVGGIQGMVPQTLAIHDLKPGLYVLAGKVGNEEIRQKVRVD